MRLILCCFSILAMQCHSQTTFMGTTLILKKGELVKVKEIDGSFTLQNCGRKSVFTNGKQMERSYCNLTVIYNGEHLYLDNSKPIFLGIYQVRITGINPWNREEYGIPANGCKLEISISPAVNFLQQYEWTTEIIVNEQPFSFPKTFTGLPWIHYAAATKQINFDLETLHSKTVQLQKVKLKEKGKRSGESSFAHIVVIDDKAITGWLSSPVFTPGIAPLNMGKSKLANW